MSNANYMKKCRKKQLRCQKLIEKDSEIFFSDIPTRTIVLCNAGLSNGLSAETVAENFAQFGQISNICMLPGKSYCCIVYNSVDSATQALSSCNGKLNIAQDNKPIYISYANEISQFPTAPTSCKRAPGLELLQNVLNHDQETILMDLVYNNSDSTEQQLKHRLVKHYGFEFNYNTNNVDPSSPLPDRIPHECETFYPLMGFVPDQLTVNCYQPGQGIPPHVDTHSAFDGPIVSLSLGSDVVMDFRHADGRHSAVHLPRRSLLIMRDEARYNWTHGITPRKLDIVQTVQGLSISKRQLRVSFTFRKVNVERVCRCKFPALCDSQKEEHIDIGEAEARKLEDVHVQQVYNNIASHFSDTRHTPWPNVLEFVQSFPNGSIIIDIGCGNGKNIGHNKNRFEIGCDNSSGLLDLCRSRELEVITCNCLTVPLRDSLADGIISIAVIHHLANEQRRRLAIEEVVRLLRVGGRALIYVWAKDQNKGDKSSYLKQDRKNRKSDSCIKNIGVVKKVEIGTNVCLPVHMNRKQFIEQDMLVPWKLKQENNEFLRYYHVYEDDELLVACKSFNNINIVNYYYDQGNWCVLFEKVSDKT